MFSKNAFVLLAFTGTEGFPSIVAVVVVVVDAFVVVVVVDDVFVVVASYGDPVKSVDKKGCGKQNIYIYNTKTQSG